MKVSPRLLIPRRHRVAARSARVLAIGAAFALMSAYWVLLRWRPRAVMGGARLIVGQPERSKQPAANARMREVVSAVDRAAELHPLRPRCLERALASRAMLHWRGEPATVAVGVTRVGDMLDAHAWVEVRHATLDASRPAFTTLIHLP